MQEETAGAHKKRKVAVASDVFASDDSLNSGELEAAI